MKLKAVLGLLTVDNDPQQEQQRVVLNNPRESFLYSLVLRNEIKNRLLVSSFTHPQYSFFFVPSSTTSGTRKVTACSRQH